jgi:POT family proton-dependent oligopeptide transporter
LYETNDRKRDAGFTVYYIGKNIGGLLAPIFCGLVAVHYGYNYAFILSSLGMVTGLIIFICGHKHLRLTSLQSVIDEPHSKQKKSKKHRIKGVTLSYLVALALIPITQFILVRGIDGYLLAGASILVIIILAALGIKRTKQERRHIFVIALMMAFVMAFGAFLNQGGTTLNLFIERVVDRQVLDFSIPPSFFYTLDPVFMIIMGPFLAGFWTLLAKRKKEPTEASKFSLAMLLLGLGFGVFVLAALQAMHIGSASPLFVVLAYFLFPLAELCIMPIGLSLVTRLAPKGTEAMLVGVWMLANAGASYLTGIISKLGEINFAYASVSGLKHAARIYMNDFGFSAIALLLLAMVLVVVIRPWTKHWGGGR